MNKLIVPLLLIASTLLFVQCEKENVSPDAGPTARFSCSEHPAVCTLTAANGNFAIDLFKKLHSEEPDNNIFISPFSISTALSMTVNGAANKTYQDMMQTLRVGGMNLDEVNQSYLTLLETLPNLDRNTKLKLANSIWYQLDFPVLQTFLNMGAKYFLSEILPVDFKKTAVVGQINSWVNDKTEGLIKEVINQIDPATRLMLINAIYFNGTWRTKFEAKNTQKANFNTNKGTVQVDMMHIPKGVFPYFQNDLFQAIDLPYGDSIFSMTILLPREGKSVGDVINAVSTENWNQWQGEFRTQQVELFMPKFKMKYDKKLKTTLTDMGMGLAFSDNADFTKMVNGGGVKIGEVIHKAFVEVNEKGTEAAAVTVVVIVVTSIPQHPVINLNKPFVFVIRDNKTNSLLFMGKMMNPLM